MLRHWEGSTHSNHHTYSVPSSAEERAPEAPRPPAPVAYVPEKPEKLNLWAVPVIGPVVRAVFALIILSIGILAGLIVILLLWDLLQLVW